jgi:hypothetical protein
MVLSKNFFIAGTLATLVVFFCALYLLGEVQEKNILLTKTSSELIILNQRVTELQLATESLVAEAGEKTKAEIEEKLASERIKLADVEKKLAAESAARAKAEADLKKTTTLSDTRLKELESNFSALDLSPIVSEWRDRTAYLECVFKNGRSNGSGILMNFFEKGKLITTILTNEHVVEVNGVPAISCSVRLPNTNTLTIFSQNQDIEISSNGYDFSRLIVRDAPASLITRAAGQANICKSRPALGEGLVVLGYPAIGAEQDITATDGIISGYAGDYYITSAKIERGNSGGPAILIKDKCLLGIPTFVTVGALEALGRVLDIGVLYR